MELNEIWPLADYITVHTPLIPQTRNLISKESLSKSKRGVKVINVARGGIINEADLLEALQSGQCGGAAVDVYEEEPPKNEVTKALIQHPSVVATPHLGASTGKHIRLFVEKHTCGKWPWTILLTQTNFFSPIDLFRRRGSGSRCSWSGWTIYRFDWTIQTIYKIRWCYQSRCSGKVSFSVMDFNFIVITWGVFQDVLKEKQSRKKNLCALNSLFLRKFLFITYFVCKQLSIHSCLLANFWAFYSWHHGYFNVAVCILHTQHLFTPPDELRIEEKWE